MAKRPRPSAKPTKKAAKKTGSKGKQARTAAPDLDALPSHLVPVLRTQNRRGARTAFLQAFKACGSVRTAAKMAGINFTTHYAWLRKDKRYQAAFERAEAQVRGMLVDEAVRRGVHGVITPVYQGGKLVGHKREYSDTMLSILLKARGGPEFKDKVEHQLTDGPIEVVVNHVRTPIPNHAHRAEDPDAEG